MIKPYNSYKSIKSDFYKEIPSDWTRYRVKNIVDRNLYYPVGDGDHGSIKPDMYLEEGIPYIRVQNLTWNGEITLDGMVYISPAVQEVNKKSILFPDDILIAKTGATVGKLGLIPNSIKEANTTSSVGKVTIDKNRFLPKYILYCFQSSIFQNQIWLEASQKSAQPGFNIDDLIVFEILAPELKIQSKIVEFLDHQTSLIDEIINRKQKQIELLKEKRQAIINETVTKGLNPDAKMKDSGIEWLGEIPEHWNNVRIGHYVQIVRGASPRPAGDPKYFGGDFIPWITVGEVTNGDSKFLFETANYLTEEGGKQSRIILPETLLLSNSGATLGVPKISKIKGCINDGSVAFLNFNPQLNRDFLFYFFKSHTEIYRKEMSGYGQPNLNTDIIKSTIIPLPPVNEQISIVEFIENKLSSFIDLVNSISFQIEKLKEYRQSIISEAVTGKIDVRDWQPNNA